MALHRKHRAQRGIDYTALVCERDVLAVTALLELESEGIRVPEEVSVLGYDDLPIASESIPPLTTVHHNIAEIIDMAVDHLVKRVQRENVDRIQRVFEHALVVRGSTGVAPRDVV